ncbi:hypothetical protein M2404_001101 [Rheinheimera pacifica]|nr:hypothetical protein [Rheinheimera pacifica]
MKIYLFIVALLLSTNAFSNVTVQVEVVRIYLVAALII